MRYVVVVNNDEILGRGDDPDFDETEYEIGELLRSGYYHVESIKPVME